MGHGPPASSPAGRVCSVTGEETLAGAFRSDGLALIPAGRGAMIEPPRGPALTRSSDLLGGLGFGWGSEPVGAQAREVQYRRELAAINKALTDNAMAVTRAMSRWYSRPGEREGRTEKVMTRFEEGSFLLNRLGAEGVIDQDLLLVLLHFRRRLIAEYGDGPAAMMLIDCAVAAYQDFIRIEGWTDNTALMVEHEFFGVDRPLPEFRDHHGREGRAIRGLTVEEYINRLGQDLIPLAERCGRVMREALAALEDLGAAPSRAVERSRPVKISILFSATRRE